MTLSLLLLGATGYLGGTVLTDLARAGEYDITCVVRPGRETCMGDRKTKLLVVRQASPVYKSNPSEKTALSHLALWPRVLTGDRATAAID